MAAITEEGGSNGQIQNLSRSQSTVFTMYCDAGDYSGYPSRPRFKFLLLALFGRVRSGGLLDVLTPAGDFIKEGETVATVTDPERRREF